jgi:4-amino-4-deoxy-L-arabinose transferase-like glycosyltransferase
MIGRSAVLALALPVACTVAFWMVLPPAYRVSESTDFSGFYEPVAKRILEGQGITTESGAVAMRYPPGYPLVLAMSIGAGGAIGLSEAHSLDLLALACVAISSLLLYLIARDLWTGWMALLPSAAFSTYPLALWLTKQPNSELVFTPILFACIYALWKLTRRVRPSIGLIVAVGVLSAVAMVVRPIALLLPLVCAALILVLALEWRLRTRAWVAAAVVGISGLTVLPWEVYASRAAGRFILMADLGVAALRSGLTFGVDNKDRAGIYVPDGVRKVMISFSAQYDELDTFGDVAHAVWNETKRHPGGMMGLVAMKMLRAWYGTDSQRLDKYVALIQVAYVLVIVAAFTACWRAGAERKRLALIIGLELIYFWGMSAVGLPLARYMVPAIGLAFVLLPGVPERATRAH